MCLETVSVLFEGADATDSATQAAQHWIVRERLPGLRIERSPTPPEEGAMGCTAATILTVILGSASIVELAKSLHNWLIARRPKLKVSIVVGKKSVQFEGENLPDWCSVLEQVTSAVKEIQ